jgi:hypothetical protein
LAFGGWYAPFVGENLYQSNSACPVALLLCNYHVQLDSAVSKASYKLTKELARSLLQDPQQRILPMTLEYLNVRGEGGQKVPACNTRGLFDPSKAHVLHINPRQLIAATTVFSKLQQAGQSIHEFLRNFAHALLMLVVLHAITVSMRLRQCS